MNKGVLVLVAVIVLGVSDSRVSAQDSPLRTWSAEVGRYQLVTAVDGRIYLFDTATGQCWSRLPGGDWRDEGNPTKTEVRRSQRPAPMLELPEKSVEMTIIQREERAIPGSHGTIRIRLGDITEGQVLLSVVAADDQYLLGACPKPVSRTNS